MFDVDELRRYALTLPGVEEGRPVPAARRVASFKVGGKSFLGVEKGERFITLSVAEADAREVIASQPAAYEAIWRRGQLFVGLRVDLMQVGPERAKGLIELSWRHSTSRKTVEPTAGPCPDT